MLTFQKAVFKQLSIPRRQFTIHLKTPCNVNKTYTYFSNKKWIIYPPNASKGTERIVSSFIAMTTFSTLLCVKNLKESHGRHWKFESVRGNCPMTVVLTDAGSLSVRRNGNPGLLVFSHNPVNSSFPFSFLCHITTKFSIWIYLCGKLNRICLR